MKREFNRKTVMKFFCFWKFTAGLQTLLVTVHNGRLGSSFDRDRNDLI